MKVFVKIIAICYFLILLSACAGKVETGQNETNSLPLKPTERTPSPLAKIPNLQTEILDDKNKTTAAPIGKFDFKSQAFPLPRGWQDPDGKETTLRPISEEKIGISYVTTKFGDVTGDGHDEAFVVLKLETGGSAIPQVVYIYEWKNANPELIWSFRTGDRADGGLKNIHAENGEVVVELYGQDRFILGEVETSRITGDEEQLCCPTFFSRTHYKWNGKNFLMQGKRLTFSLEERSAPPVQNMGDIVNEKEKPKK